MSPKNEGETKKQSGSKLREAPVIPVAAGETDSTPASPSGKSVDLDHLGELPQSYGSDTIFLIAQEPHWLFTYWDIDISRHPGGKTFLRVYEGEKTVEAKIEVPFETRNWYIPVKRAGAKYTVEIGYNRGSVWKVIARSHTIETQPDHLSDSDQFDYATIPLHLSFQKLVESIQQGIQTGETLITALSRLQKEGKPFAFGSDALPGISLEQRIVLEALLGSNFIEELASGGLSSQEVEAKVRKYLEEKLSSQGPISSFSREQWSAAESSLFSALGALSSEQVASWGPAELSSWAAAVLSSWAAAGESSGWSGESLGSWARAAESSGGLASWFQAGESSWAQAAISSWLQGAQSSWAQAALSSWLQGAQSSWAQAALSSWSQASVTSWSQAAVTSWSGASEWVSSFGVARNFFMHVNAEVIFYGGTDPRAKVTIDGKPITLNPDGSFRYHFIFPDGVYEIPVVAVSPDGVESRSAILRFQRSTQKSGKVDNTAQPSLAPPMGSVY